MTTETTAPVETTEPVTEESAPVTEENAEPPSPEEVAAQEANARRESRIREAQDAEARATERREASMASRERARLQQERAEFERQRSTWNREVEERAEAIKRGGPDALKALANIDIRDLNRAWIAQQDPNVQAQIEAERARQETDRKLKEFDEWKSQQQDQARSRAAEEGMRNVMQVLNESEETYPNAWELTEREQRAAIGSIATTIAQRGEPITIARVLRLLDDEAKLLHDEREQRRSQRKTSAKPSNGPVTPATPNSSTAIRSSNQRTLTSADANKKAAVRSKLTEVEKDEMFRQQLRDAMRSDGAKAS